ncbi:histidinol-phosphatase [Phreatobacter aquaticus]|uniref:Histidinol-phosphatase n=1 Tax=Phreatobacter aquaticus TaxID=2570229 RepID=A0A4D7Q8D5_9HYPH|nr:histidinol-phosphatase [Phreatobacter aquaticus]QCK84430.1 histidinol-phosphatase [Phreatobacter aquaticus]
MSAVDIEAFVHDLARLSGEAILPFFRSAIGVDNKAAPGSFDPVTEGDRAGEAVMRQMIKRTFPAHGIVGEEYGAENEEAEHVWVLDPIDGTRAFIAGIPVWGTLIGLAKGGAPAFGMMHQPFTREKFWGDGAKAHYSGPAGDRLLRVRPCETLAAATIMTTSPKLFGTSEKPRFDALESQCRTYRYGADCYAYCMVAAGQVDLVVEAGLKPYDIMALIPIVEGAGGIVTSWDGGSAASGGRILAAGDKRVHEQAMAVLNG